MSSIESTCCELPARSCMIQSACQVQCCDLQVLQNGSAKPEAQVGAAVQSKPAAAVSDLEGVPPLPACRVQLLWDNDVGRAAQVDV
jgi:hypothetical protein